MPFVIPRTVIDSRTERFIYVYILCLIKPSSAGMNIGGAGWKRGCRVYRATVRGRTVGHFGYTIAFGVIPTENDPSTTATAATTTTTATTSLLFAVDDDVFNRLTLVEHSTEIFDIPTPDPSVFTRRIRTTVVFFCFFFPPPCIYFSQPSCTRMS